MEGPQRASGLLPEGDARLRAEASGPQEDALRPRDAAQLAEAVAAAAASGSALELRGGGSKRGYGRPRSGAERVLDLSALSGVLEYEPAELVLTARAATPLCEVEALLARSRQMLAFEPVSWSGLFGAGASGAAPTLGGTLACNLAGPRRVRAGAARDHFLGFTAVNGWGDAYKAGGRVVKNVTGYDLCKLHAGALGTLSVLDEVCVKVLPRPETERTLLATGLDAADAVRLMADALNAPHEVSAAAHLPGPQAAAALEAALGGTGAVTALRIEGHAPSVATRAAAMQALAAACVPGHALAWLEPAASARLWRSVGEVEALAATAGQVVWRVSTAPADSPSVAAAIRAVVPEAAFLYDWGGALLWVALPGDVAGGDRLVRGALRGGHATLVRAPAAMRAALAVFEPEPAPLAALSRRVKAQFDPGCVLNPGRMREEGGARQP